MVYYKIQIKRVGGNRWLDDLNNPDDKDPYRTKRYKSLSAAKRAYKKMTWSLPHYKRIVAVSGRKIKAVYMEQKVFGKKRKRGKKKRR